MYVREIWSVNVLEIDMTWRYTLDDMVLTLPTDKLTLGIFRQFRMLIIVLQEAWLNEFLIKSASEAILSFEANVRLFIGCRIIRIQTPSSILETHRHAKSFFQAEGFNINSKCNKYQFRLLRNFSLYNNETFNATHLRSARFSQLIFI